MTFIICPQERLHWGCCQSNWASINIKGKPGKVKRFLKMLSFYYNHKEMKGNFLLIEYNYKSFFYKTNESVNSFNWKNKHITNVTNHCNSLGR